MVIIFGRAPQVFAQNDQAEEDGGGTKKKRPHEKEVGLPGDSGKTVEVASVKRRRVVKASK